jgi:hypothetical protein
MKDRDREDDRGDRDRDRDYERENGANGDDRKGKQPRRTRSNFMR